TRASAPPTSMTFRVTGAFGRFWAETPDRPMGARPAAPPMNRRRGAGWNGWLLSFFMISSLNDVCGFLSAVFQLMRAVDFPATSAGEKILPAPVGLWFPPLYSASHTFDSGFRRRRMTLATAFVLPMASLG